MVLPQSFPEVNSIHAYSAVFALGVTFTLIGQITELQLAIATIFFGFVALMDTLGDLLLTLDKVITELHDVNDRADDPDRDSDFD